MLNITDLRSTVPAGECGFWSVHKFAISEEDAKRFNMREQVQMMQKGGSDRRVKAGNYTRLCRGSATNVIMSDTPAEMNDLRYFAKAATGNVMIGGLGLGMAVIAALQKPEVKKITVVEVDPDVIALTWPTICKLGMEAARAEHPDCELPPGNNKVKLVPGSIFDWKPPKNDGLIGLDAIFDVVWLDIWDSICPDNLKEMGILKRKFRRYTLPGAWIGCWSEMDCRKARVLEWSGW